MQRTHLIKSLALACALWGALPAYAADANSTDQLVVKYRSNSAQRLDARSLNRALHAASRFRMSVQSATAQGGGTFVLHLDRCVPLQHVMAVAGELETLDDQVESAHAEMAENIGIVPSASNCVSQRSSQSVAAR